MLLVVSVVIDTERPEAVAVYCNGLLVWPSRAWVIRAPCRGLDPGTFVPEVFNETPAVVATLCPSCPVRQACEDYGRTSRSIGWWGGVLLQPSGRPNPRRIKLTWDQVTEIRQRHAEGATRLQLAQEYGVHRCTIAGIVSGTIRTVPPRPGTSRVAARRKLPLDDVAEMRQRHAAGGVSISALAREYGVNPSYASKIIRGEVLA
jgi:AraC-like DNA-binding protein